MKKPLYNHTYSKSEMNQSVFYLGTHGDSDYYLRINQVNEAIIDKRYGNSGFEYSNWSMDIIQDHYEHYDNFETTIPKPIYLDALSIVISLDIVSNL